MGSDGFLLIIGEALTTRTARYTVTLTLRRNEVSGEIDGYDFEGPTRFDKLFTGIAVERPKDLNPNDLEPGGLVAESD